METTKDRTQKLSITDQGKGANLLRKRLAFALATSSKPNVKSEVKMDNEYNDSGECSAQEEPTEVHLRKISVRETSKRSANHRVKSRSTNGAASKRSVSNEELRSTSEAGVEHSVNDDESRSTNEAVESSSRKERSRRLGFVSLPTNVGFGKEKREMNAKGHRITNLISRELPSHGITPSTKNEESPIKSKVKEKSIEVLGELSNIDTMKRIDSLVSKRLTTNATSDHTLRKHAHEDNDSSMKAEITNDTFRLEFLESEVMSLKLDVSRTLQEFKGLNRATEHLRNQMQALREDRIRLFGSDS